MKSRLLTYAAVIIGLFIIDAKVADASGHLFRSRVIGNWNAESTWEVYTVSADASTAGTWKQVGTGTTTFPSAGDTAILMPNFFVTLTADRNSASTDEAPANLIVRPGGKLITGAFELEVDGFGGLSIESGGIVDVSANSGQFTLSGGGEHNVNGQIKLNGSTAKLRFDNDTQIGGSGKIIATGSTVVIDIDASSATVETLTIGRELTFEGKFTVTRNNSSSMPIFRNNGLVHANVASGLITLQSVDVRGTGEFRMSTGASAEIFFDETGDDTVATHLQALFSILDSGILDSNVPLRTGGGLYMEGSGTVECNGGQCIFSGAGR